MGTRLPLVVLVVGLAVALVGPGPLRDAEAFLEPGAVFRGAALVAALAALRGLVAAWRSPEADGGGEAWGWFSLAILGQAATWMLVKAGPVVSYQHFRTSQLEDPVGVWAAAVFGLQVVLVLGHLVGPRRALVSRGLARLGFLPLLLIAGGLFVVGAKPSVDLGVFGLELAFAFLVQFVQCVTVVLAVSSLSEVGIDRWRARFDRILGGDGSGRNSVPEPGGLDRFAIGLALAVTGIAIVLAWTSYQRHPHVPDEVVYLTHARYLAEGFLELPMPEPYGAFDIDLMLPVPERGVWYCPVPPGWPLALAVGAFFDAAWLVNPCLTGIDVLLVYLLARELFSRRRARVLTLLLCASPWFLFMGMNFMTHQWTFCCALLGALGIARARRRASLLDGTLAGLATGMVSLIRPLEGFGVAMLLGLWSLGLGGRRIRPGATVALVLGAVFVGVLGLLYNQRMTGSPMNFPIMEYCDVTYGPGTNSLGFGPEKGLGWPGLDPYPGHDLKDAVLNADFNVFAIGTELLGWGVSSWILVLALLATGGVRRGDKKWLMAVLTFVVLNSFYWFSGGPDFGGRYWYLILLPCLILSLRGMERVAECLGDDPRSRTRVELFVALSATIALLAFVPWRAIDKYHHYRGMRPDVRELALESGFGQDVVFISGARHPDYASAAIENPVVIEPGAEGPLYAWLHEDGELEEDEQIAEVMKHYPGRGVWILDGPSVTGRGFEIRRRPGDIPEEPEDGSGE